MRLLIGLLIGLLSRLLVRLLVRLVVCGRRRELVLAVLELLPGARGSTLRCVWLTVGVVVVQVAAFRQAVQPAQVLQQRCVVVVQKHVLVIVCGA
jgi:hypothetical protein